MVKDKRQKLVLLDTHAIIHRAYHALPDFLNSKGEPTGAIYGLATMLFKIITEFKPDYIIACYDLPKKTFRHVAYENYKAGRAKADEALVTQIISSKKFFEAFSIPVYELAGFEADDLLGTISEKIINDKKFDNVDVIIASGDMDTLQLASDDRIKIYTLKKGINDTILYNEKLVSERFGFSPKFLPDYKGLRGDPSDNIIGIKGIGEKTASILISKYNSLENLYKKLKDDKEELKKNGITDRIFNLLTEGQDEAIFSKVLATIRKDAPIDFVLPDKKWANIVDKENVISFFREMEFRSLQNRFLNLFENKESDLIEKDKKENQEQNVDNQILEKAKIAFWLLNSERTNPSFDEVVNYKKANSLEEALEKMEEDIKKENLDFVYREIELPIIPIIKKMEKTGILIDQNYLSKISKQYKEEFLELEKQIWQQVGREFNINSPKQLGDVLFDDLGLFVKGLKKSAGGARSTKESELEKLKDLHPVISLILEYRELQKLISTYLNVIPLNIDNSGRLHTSFIQTGTTTGRFASNNPNLQNIPVKTEKGKNIREVFIAAPSCKLVSFDYSQIELRVTALLSQDEYFIKVFEDGGDIHTRVAMKVFNVSEENVTHEMRRRAKIINFGILYGMGVTALKQNLNSSREEAQKFFDQYFNQFPTIANYLESIKNFAKEYGYTKTLFGRKRYFPGIHSKIPFIKAMAERMATNAPIQGTATADIIKIGMKKAEEGLAKANIIKDCHLLLQVHDELIYEIKDDKVNEAIKIIELAMQDAIPDEFLKDLKKVSLVVSVAIGKNWGELK